MRVLTNIRITTFVICLQALLSGCGGGGGETPEVQVARTQDQTPTVRVLGSSGVSEAPCAECTFGPVTYVRSTGKPVLETSSIVGDATTSYVIDIDDQGSEGADGTVVLDGTTLLASRTGADVGTRHVTLNVPLTAQSKLSVRLTGKPGSTLRVSIRAGAQLIGPRGGKVVASAGAVKLDIPEGALLSPTVITISRKTISEPEGALGQAVDLGPDGLTFPRPVKLTMTYEPQVLEGASASILRIATIVNSDWMDLPTTLDSELKTLSTDLEHFSPYAYKEKDGQCVTSGDADYDKKMASLAQAVFRLDSPAYKGTGCVNEGYLQDKYSEHFPSMQNHAGIDFLVGKGTKAFALAGGWVEDSRLNKDVSVRSSTLVIRTKIGGVEHRVLYLHCDSHIHIRNGLILGSLDGTYGTEILAGDEVCQTGNVGAGKVVNGVEVKGYHMHLELKTLAMDSINPLFAVSGSHCKGQTFINYQGISVPGCPYAYIQANTVDPTLLLSSEPADLVTWVFRGRLTSIGSDPWGRIPAVFGGALNLGQHFIYEVKIKRSASDALPNDPNQGLYTAASQSVKIGSYVALVLQEPSEKPYVSVSNSISAASTDVLYFGNGSSNPCLNGICRQVGAQFQGPAGVLLTDGIPVIAPDVSVFYQRLFQVVLYATDNCSVDCHTIIYGSIDSVSIH